MKINKKFIEQLTGSLSREKLEGKTDLLTIFNVINNYNSDNKIDTEDIAKFANSIWQKDDGDGILSDKEIESFIGSYFRGMDRIGITAKSIKQFFNFFIKNSEKSSHDKLIINEDGTCTVITKQEESEKNTKNPVTKVVVDKKTNYNAKGEITTVEEIRDNMTTITDSEGRPLQVIIKNNNAKDTIKEYKYAEIGGKKEEAIFYGDNGVKDSDKPAYKNIYEYDRLIYRIEYDGTRETRHYYNYKKDKIVRVNDLELFKKDSRYNLPNEVFDKIIDPSQQNYTGDCWLLNGLSMLSRTSWGRKMIEDSISSFGDDIHVYLHSKSYKITKEELEQAKNAHQTYYKLEMSKGDAIYIDGKKELVPPNNSSFYFDAATVNSNITIVDRNGKKRVLAKEDLENNSKCKVEGPKYSSGDLTTLAFELAVEKFRQESGLSLEGGTTAEIVSMLIQSDNITYNIIDNSEITNTKPNSNSLHTNSQSKAEALYAEREFEERYANEIIYNYSDASSAQLIDTLKKVKDNSDKYAVSLSIIMDGGLHAAHLLRLEESDGEDYIVYTHPWDNKAEIREPLDNFVKNSLARISLFENNRNDQIQVNADSKIGSFKMGNKSNRTNFVSVIAALGQDKNFKPNITKDENNNYVVKIKDKNITITPSDVETAKASGFYSTSDDDVSILELAVERYINNTRHQNTMYELAHTNLEDVKFEDIMSLFSNKKIVARTTNLQEASKMHGTQFVCQKTDNGDRYLAVKEIKCMPDGTYKISVIQPENTSIVVTYLANEFEGEIITFKDNVGFGMN